MDEALVFKALADSNRRMLLDSLFVRDGQTLGDLEKCLEQMTRFGVMKHLRVLEDAGLVVTQRQGREKLHFLNPTPIGEVYDRWVGKYATPHLRVLSGVKSSLETRTMTDTKVNTHLIQTYIRATPEQVWNALIDPDITEKYFFGTRVVTDLKPGTPFRYIDHKGEVVIDGEVVESDPPNRLVVTFIGKWNEETVDGGTVTYELIPMDDLTKVRLTHVGIPEGHPLVQETFNGWSYILAGLKTLLETGKVLEAQPSA